MLPVRFPGASLDLDLCEFCHATCRGKRALPGAVVALRFAPPADELIRDLKYHGITPNARVLGVLLAQAVRERGAPLPRLLMPVPLHDARCASAASTRPRRSRVTRANARRSVYAARREARARHAVADFAEHGGAASQRARGVCRARRARAAQVVRRGTRGRGRRRHDHGQHARGSEMRVARGWCQAGGSVGGGSGRRELPVRERQRHHLEDDRQRSREPPAAPNSIVDTPSRYSRSTRS